MRSSAVMVGISTLGMHYLTSLTIITVAVVRAANPTAEAFTTNISRPPLSQNVGAWPVQNHLLTLDPHPKLIVKEKHGIRRVLQLDALPLPGTSYLHVDLNAALPRLVPQLMPLLQPEHTGQDFRKVRATRMQVRRRSLKDTKGRQGTEEESEREDEGREEEDNRNEKGRISHSVGAPLRSKKFLHRPSANDQPPLLCLPLSSPFIRSATKQLSRIRPYSLTRYLDRPEEMIICYRQRDLQTVGYIL